MVFISAQGCAGSPVPKDNDAILNERARTTANPTLNRPGVPGLLDAILASQNANHNVNAVIWFRLPPVQSQNTRKFATGSICKPLPALRWKRFCR